MELHAITVIKSMMHKLIFPLKFMCGTNFHLTVKNLRSSSEGVRDISTAPSPTTESLMGTLQVCRLNVPLSRQRSLPSLFSDYGSSQGRHWLVGLFFLSVCA